MKQNAQISLETHLKTLEKIVDLERRLDEMTLLNEIKDKLIISHFRPVDNSVD